MSLWLPIEGAPKDGTPILAWDGDRMTVVIWQPLTENGYWSLHVCGGYAYTGDFSPTHWMPLPAPPKEA